MQASVRRDCEQGQQNQSGRGGGDGGARNIRVFRKYFCRRNESHRSARSLPGLPDAEVALFTHGDKKSAALEIFKTYVLDYAAARAS